MIGRRLAIAAVPLLSLLAAMGPIARAGGASPDDSIDFDRDIRPILSDKCFACHGPDEGERQSGLRLDLREAALKPADSGKPAIVPGRADEGTLVRRISSRNPGYAMPPVESNRTLSEADRAKLRAWVEGGAKYAVHWSFAPIERPEPPEVADESWPRNAIDRFVLARLEAEGVEPSPEADRATLIRRLSLDLRGLPPEAREVDAFLADDRPDAYEQLVDALLASPHFGERMALDWLDAARFADTHGYHIDSGRDMTRWRDWVIGAFNRDLPFDRFTVEQLAGDLLPEPTADQLIASGFNRNHMINFEGGAFPEEYRTAYVLDRLNTTSTVWLGLTVACAQCHDHKFDPIAQEDFYRLFAFFNSVPENGLDGRAGNAEPLLKLPGPGQEAERERLSAAIEESETKAEGSLPAADFEQAVWEFVAHVGRGEGLPANLKKIVALDSEGRTKAQRDALKEHFRATFTDEGRRLAGLRKAKETLEAAIPSAMVMRDLPEPRETFLLLRGQYDAPGKKVTPGVPGFLPPLPAGREPADRLDLARWLVGPAHPLTARVIVNRYWQMAFGRGLVGTAGDFGAQGDQPTHPDLLDWLASEFRDGEGTDGRPWDVKGIVRAIVGSATYRQSSVVSPSLLADDPDNLLLARAPRLRLPAELIRDQALAAAGLLDRRIGGASVSPYQPAGIWEELAYRMDNDRFTAQVYRQDHGPDLYRRTMYTFWKRTSPPPSLSTFDAPDRETCTVRRARTNTPLQALVLMNDPTYVEAARKLAERMMTEAGARPDDRIALGFRLVAARRPEPAESAVLRSLFDDLVDRYRRDPAAALKVLATGEAPRRDGLDPAELAAWTLVASAILNLDEAVTRG